MKELSKLIIVHGRVGSLYDCGSGSEVRKEELGLKGMSGDGG